MEADKYVFGSERIPSWVNECIQEVIESGPHGEIDEAMVRTSKGTERAHFTDVLLNVNSNGYIRLLDNATAKKYNII